MRWHVLIAVVIPGMLACSDRVGPETGVGPVEVRPAAVQYPAGATVRLTLTNLARSRLLYTPCFSRLEQRSAAGQWIVVYEDPSPCPAVVRFLEPGASELVEVLLPVALRRAAHRIRFPSIGLPQDGRFVTATQIGDGFLVHP